MIPKNTSKLLKFIGTETIWAIGAEQGVANVYAEQELSEDTCSLLLVTMWPADCRVIVAKRPLPKLREL
jgi:hypothetical protein